MAGDADWVEDVRRWYFARRHEAPAVTAAGVVKEDSVALGYEAAHPSLQAHHWPDAPSDTTSTPS